jgi:hypothetical protein
MSLVPIFLMPFAFSLNSYFTEQCDKTAQCTVTFINIVIIQYLLMLVFWVVTPYGLPTLSLLMSTQFFTN